MKSQARSEGEFLELVQANRQRILRICRVYAWTPQDQEDLYQDVLFQIWRALPGLNHKVLANTWLYRVTLNTAMSFSRKHARQRSAQPVEGAELRQMAEERQGVAEATDPRLEALYEAIGLLNETERAAITLFLEGLSYDEIAGVLGLEAGHIGVLLHRAKKKLSQLMTEELA